MGLAYAPLALIVLREAPTETQGTASSALSLMDTLGHGHRDRRVRGDRRRGPALDAAT